MTQDECFLGVDESDPDDIHAYLDQVEGETDPDETRHQESAVGRRAVMLLGLLLEEGLHMWGHVEAEVMRIVGAAGALGLYDLRLPMSLQIGQLADSDLTRELEDLGINPGMITRRPPKIEVTNKGDDYCRRMDDEESA